MHGTGFVIAAPIMAKTSPWLHPWTQTSTAFMHIRITSRFIQTKDMFLLSICARMYRVCMFVYTVCLITNQALTVTRFYYG